MYNRFNVVEWFYHKKKGFSYGFSHQLPLGWKAKKEQIQINFMWAYSRLFSIFPATKCYISSSLFISLSSFNLFWHFFFVFRLFFPDFSRPHTKFLVFTVAFFFSLCYFQFFFFLFNKGRPNVYCCCYYLRHMLVTVSLVLHIFVPSASYYII